MSGKVLPVDALSYHREASVAHTRVVFQYVTNALSSVKPRADLYDICLFKFGLGRLLSFCSGFSDPRQTKDSVSVQHVFRLGAWLKVFNSVIMSNAVFVVGLKAFHLVAKRHENSPVNFKPFDLSADTDGHHTVTIFVCGSKGGSSSLPHKPTEATCGATRISRNFIPNLIHA